MFQVAGTILLAEKYDMEYAFRPAWKYRQIFKNAEVFRELKDTKTFEKIWIKDAHAKPVELEKKDIIIESYFQNHEYFSTKEIQTKLEQVFAPNEEALERIRKRLPMSLKDLSNFCAVHVRRGDYTQIHDNICLPWSYYEGAMNYMEKVCKTKGFLFFSDDPSFVRSMTKFLTTNCIVMSNDGNDIDDLFMMAACGHQIIANSSFSWWSAYLNQTINPSVGKRVIAPDIWFKHVKNSHEILMPEWIRFDRAGQLVNCYMRPLFAIVRDIENNDVKRAYQLLKHIKPLHKDEIFAWIHEAIRLGQKLGLDKDVLKYQNVMF